MSLEKLNLKMPIINYMVPSLLVCLLLTQSCSQDQQSSCNENYGMSYNKVREDFGWPIIENDWIIHSCDSNYVNWSNSENRVTTYKPMHLWKRIYLKNNILIKEEDDFHFESKTDTAFRLVVNWFPSSNSKDSTNFEIITYYKEEFPPTTSKFISDDEADSVLNSWGVKSFRFGKSRK